MASEDFPADKVRRIYGRGFVDGLRYATTKGEQQMTPKKYQQAEASITAMARKVLLATPIQEAWSTEQIMSELMRTGHRVPHNVVLGCLSSLIDAGLIKEPQSKTFIRVTPRVTLVEAPKEIEVAEANESPAQAGSTSDRMGRISAVLRDMSKSMMALADELDLCAVEVEARSESSSEAEQKLEELRRTLGNLLTK